MNHIWIKGQLYMRRFPIIETPWFSIRLHNIVLPDQRQPLHNHPFKWWRSIVLWGGYVERRHRPFRFWEGLPTEEKRAHARGDRNGMTGPDEYHRIDYVLPNTWTLFIYGRRITSWGFLVNGKHVDEADYKKEHGE